MSNRVDYCHGEERLLAVPAGRAVVFVDGVLCPHFEVVRIVRSAGPGYGSAVLAYNPAVHADGERVAVEQIETIAAMGKCVRIVMPYDGGFGRTQVEGLCLFCGYIEKIDTVVGPDGEAVEATAYDFATKMGRVTVYGQRVSDELSLEGCETVFNHDGLPNASQGLITHGGREYRVFAADDRSTRLWTVVEAVVYLLSEYVAAGRLGMRCVEQLEGLFGSKAASEIDVDGMSLLAAIEKCCEGTGVWFRFEPCQEEAGPGERIVFYRDGKGRKVELNLQQQGEKLSISRTNIHRMESERKYWPVTHRYIGRGGWKLYEATFDLVEAWDSSLEGLSQGEYSPSTSSDFEKVRDVYRKWCLNEAGDYAGSAFDFSSLFEQAGYVQKRRRFLKATGGYLLEVSYNDGATWGEFDGSYEVLDAECGVWIADDSLATAMWTAIGTGALKFRMTAAVESDERLTISVADGPVGSCAEVVDHIIDVSEYEYRKAVPGGVFIDDSIAMHAYLRQLCQANRSVIETVDIETPLVGLYYNCGDRVLCGPDSRDVLGTRRDDRSVFVVEQVVVDFRKQCTRLRILRRRV
jgi:hypothetical protein